MKLIEGHKSNGFHLIPSLLASLEYIKQKWRQKLQMTIYYFVFFSIPLPSSPLSVSTYLHSTKYNFSFILQYKLQ